VLIVRTGAMALEVCGPGHSRERYSFAAETQLVSFLRDTDDRLVSAGYRPRGYATERRNGDERRDRPRSRDRRAR